MHRHFKWVQNRGALASRNRSYENAMQTLDVVGILEKAWCVVEAWTRTEKMVVGVSLILEGQTTVADVVQVLQPLKVWNRNTSSVQVHVLKRAHM